MTNASTAPTPSKLEPVCNSTMTKAAAEPATIDLAELRVTVPVGMLFQVLEVEQLQGDAGLAALGVQGGAVGLGPAAAPGHVAPAVQPSLQGVLGQGLHLDPVERGGLGAQHRRPDGAVTDAEALGDRPMAAAQGEPLAKNLPRVSHRQSLGSHSSPFGWMALSDRPVPLRSGHPPRGGCPAGRVTTRTDPGGHDADAGDHDGPIGVTTMLRSTCPRWAETRTLGKAVEFDDDEFAFRAAVLAADASYFGHTAGGQTLGLTVPMALADFVAAAHRAHQATTSPWFPRFVSLFAGILQTTTSESVSREDQESADRSLRQLAAEMDLFLPTAPLSG
jgi:hypothetical protein